MNERNKPFYRIIGAYDSETTNYTENGVVSAFPILHQLGILDGTPVAEITAENVEDHTDIELYRHSFELYERLDAILEARSDFVPVICCHNLAFDMYGLSQWLNRHDVRVLAKSARKPISFTVMNEAGNPGLVIWDTLIFTQQSLERMGNDCGYSKGVGEWDYSLIRTPETPLTLAEVDYSKRDIYTLLAYLGWWIRRNPDIEPSKLALNVVTKTGVVRERRKVRYQNTRGIGRKQNIGRYWLYQNSCSSQRQTTSCIPCRPALAAASRSVPAPMQACLSTCEAPICASSRSTPRRSIRRRWSRIYTQKGFTKQAARF